MRCAIETLQCKLVELKRMRSEYQWFNQQIHKLAEPFPFEINVSELQKAIAHLQGYGTQPTIDNNVSMAIAQLVTDFITSHDLTEVQSITMRNFLDWVALQHT